MKIIYIKPERAFEKTLDYSTDPFKFDVIPGTEFTEDNFKAVTGALAVPFKFLGGCRPGTKKDRAAYAAEAKDKPFNETIENIRKNLTTYVLTRKELLSGPVVAAVYDPVGENPVKTYFITTPPKDILMVGMRESHVKDAEEALLDLQGCYRLIGQLRQFDLEELVKEDAGQLVSVVQTPSWETITLGIKPLRPVKGKCAPAIFGVIPGQQPYEDPLLGEIKYPFSKETKTWYGKKKLELPKMRVLPGDHPSRVEAKKDKKKKMV